MEATEPPFSAHAVASMNLQTDVGKATVKQVCGVFGLSRQAYYAAKRPTGDVAKPLRETNAAPREPA